MLKRYRIVFVVLCLALVCGALPAALRGAKASGTSAKTPPSSSATRSDKASAPVPSQIEMPLAFVENRGQWNAATKFAVRDGAMTARFERNAMRLVYGAERATSVSLIFEGASGNAELAGEGSRTGYYNFFLGNDSAKWRSNVPAYDGLRYRNLYRDVDLRVREASGTLEYDLLLDAGADLEQVVIRADGATRLEISADGALLVHTANGTLRQKAPTTWEELPDGERRFVACRFKQLDARRYGFDVGQRNQELPLVIDPGLEWATFLGGGGHETVRDVALARDGSGDMILVGATTSYDFPASGGHLNANGQSSYVARLSASGAGLVYATLFGGSGSTGNDLVAAVALDESGAPVVVGSTGSADFPTTPGAFDKSYNGGADAFVTRFDATGSRIVFSTYLGGAKDEPSSAFFSSSGYDEASVVGFDAAGSVIVAGNTTSRSFPSTPGAYDTTANPYSNASQTSMQDAFLARLDATGAQLTYATYLGGQASDYVHDMAIDAQGVVSLVGYTIPLSTRDLNGNETPLGTPFPTTAGAFDQTYNGNGDAVLVRLKPDGAGAADLKYSTFLGGNDTDEAWAVALDPNDSTSVTVIAETFSGNFPVTAGTLGQTHFMPGDATMVTISRFRFPAAGGGSLAWSTYYGGAGFQSADDGVVDEAGAVVVVGSNSTSNPPTTERAFDRTPETSDGFVTRISADGTQLLYSTLLGGASFEGNLRVASLGGNSVVVAGQTKSPDFPVTLGAFDTIYSTSGNPSEFTVYDAFVASVNLAPNDIGDVTANAPALLAPANGLTVNAPAVVDFDWEDAADASGVEAYHIQVSPNAAFADSINARTSGWYEKWIPASQASTDFSSAFTGTFYWRVQTLDAAHNLSAWSQVRTFTVGRATPPVAPSLTYPPSASRLPPNQSISFMWNAVAGASSYEIQIDDSSSFGAPLTLSRGGLTATQTTHTFTSETSYSWRVRAVNGAGIGAWSAARQFQVKRGSTVPPPPAGTPALSALSVNPSSVTGGNSSLGTVTLTNAAPSGGALVALSSSSQGVAGVPASVIIPAGTTSATFTTTTVQVNAATSVTITASYGGVARTALLSVQPVAPPPPTATLSALSLNPTSVTGGNSSQGTVTLSSPAPSGGAVVTLSSSSAAASVPASVTIAAGSSSATFAVSTQSVTATASVTVAAASGGVSRTATLAVNPATTPPPATDTVAIQRADYTSSKRQLRVDATSSNSSAVLRCYVAATGQLIGTLSGSGGRYSGQFTVNANPQTIIVRSSLGGSATRNVSSK